MALHPKILALRNSIGSQPILFAHKLKKLELPLEVRAAIKPSDDPRLLKQYFCIWGIPDDYGTVPIKGCFTRSLNARGPETNASYKITALYMHSQSDSVGLPTVLKEDEIGLYGEVPILPDIQVCDELVIRHKNGVCNNGSYGFNYIWDKMEYDEVNEVILMKECDLFEVSFVTIGSQTETFGVRNNNGVFVDDTLAEDTEDMIRRLPRKEHLEIRNLINRHISLAKLNSIETRQQSLEDGNPKQEGIDFEYLINNL